MDAGIPVLNPAGVQEFLDLGIYGWALSRYSGCWTAFKVVAETVESSASVHVDPPRIELRMPTEFEMLAGRPNIRPPHTAPATPLAPELHHPLHRHHL